jgi:uncharacterized membrane protein YedE/YeeE
MSSVFADPGILLAGAATGLVFGYLLQKGGVTRFKVIVNQFLLKDFTMLKIMVAATIVGGVGIYAMRSGGIDFKMHVKSATLLGNALGGLIFGAGMALLGYCPGTGMAAIGDGSRHAIPGVLGMLVGAAIYAEAYPWVNDHILKVANEGKVTLPEATGIAPWIFFAVIAAAAWFGFKAIDKALAGRAT